jgi:hypothetical protein
MYVCHMTYILVSNKIPDTFQTMETSLDWPPPKNWSHLWPALKGSLAQIYKPCIRPGCPQCLQGDKHPAFILSFSQAGKRRSMYVPQALVPWLRRALENGRQLEKLLSAQGPLMLKDYRQNRDRQSRAAVNNPPPRSKLSTGKKHAPKPKQLRKRPTKS